MFKQLTLAATLAATATFAAPGAQAFSLGDALGIAGTVINTVQTIENGINGNQPAPQVQQPQVQQPQPTQLSASEQQQMDETAALLCSSNSGGSTVAALQILGMSDHQCTDEQNATHDDYRSEVRQLTVQCQAALGPSAYWSESNGACRDGRPSVGSNLRGPGTVSYGSYGMR